MKFFLANKTKENFLTMLRAAGYRFWAEKEGKMNFIRPFGSRGVYPRFHLYILSEPAKNETLCELHLDQKQPSYKGAVAHNAEYEGEILEEEITRIKGVTANL